MKNILRIVLTSIGAVALMALPACTDDDTSSALASDWKIQPGVGLVTVTHAEPGQPLTLINDEGKKLITMKADEFGQLSIAMIPDKLTTIQAGPKAEAGSNDGELLQPGKYTLVDESNGSRIESQPFEVTDIDDIPDPEFYDQELTGISLPIIGDPPEGTDVKDGFQYIETRDGTKLSAMIRYPDTSIYGDGPWPTVIETSGYGVSNPGAEEPGARIARALGYATVSVNIRGTGCSGGVFDIFTRAQMADGYDVIETVARQPWVLHNKVGMVGLSYSGITQLYTAATAPPSLAAITAQSTIVDPWRQQWPGGLYNAGFTRRWLEERDRQAAPNGFDWVKDLADSGDKTCKEHQQLRNINVDFQRFGRSLEMRPVAADDRDLMQWVPKITAATFLTGAFQDEQVGVENANMIGHFDSAAAFKAAYWNGRHPDGYSPYDINRMFEFLEFYVAKRVPKMNPLLRSGLPAELASNFDITDAPVEGDRFASYGDDYDGALAAYEAEPTVRVNYEAGAGGTEVGSPYGTFQREYTAWPPPESKITNYYVEPGGVLADGTTESTAPAAADPYGFAPDTNAADKVMTVPDGNGLLARLWDFDWKPFAADKSVSVLTAPLAADGLIAGPAEADLYVAANGADDADLQVTLSEVRPDGVEYLWQSGWLRLGHRKVAEDSEDTLTPRRTYYKADYEKLPDGEFVRARVSIPSFATPVRAGSRIKMTISSPGRDRSEWTFEPRTYATGDDADVSYEVGVGGDHASRLRLSVLGDPGEIPAANPACPSLRGQACRVYQAAE